VQKSLVFIFSFLILTRFNIDPDLGWHLAYGREFLEVGRIIRVDEFSWTMSGYAWGNSYFLYQILVTFIFNNFGHIASGLIFGVLAAIGVTLIFKRVDLWKFLLLWISAMLASANLGIRPHTFSFLFFAVLLVLLERRFFEKWWQPFFWFSFFCLWANLHRGFLVGLLVFGAFVILDALFLRAQKKRIKFSKRVPSLVAAILGTLVTPFPFELWHSGVIIDVTSKANLLTIAEWQSIAFFFPINLLWAFCGLVFIYVFLKKSKEIEPVWLLIGAGCFMFSFIVSTFAFYWVLIFLFIVSRHLEFKFFLKWDFWAKLPLWFSIGAVFVVVFLSQLAHALESYELANRLKIDKYPVGALDFLRQNNLGASIFNEYGWGGFIDWRYPEIQVFIDGRMASWRKEEGRGILDDYLAIRGGKCDALGNYGIQTVLVNRDTDTKCFSEFNKVYEDEVAKVLQLGW